MIFDNFSTAIQIILTCSFVIIYLIHVLKIEINVRKYKKCTNNYFYVLKKNIIRLPQNCILNLF